MTRTPLTWLNDLVGYVPVRTKLLVAFALLSGLPLAIGGSVGTKVASEALEEQALQRLNAEVDTMRTAFETLLGDTESDLDMLAAAPEIPLLVSDEPAALATMSLRERFRRYLDAKTRSVQVRVLDASGMQVMQVDAGPYVLGGPGPSMQPFYVNQVAAEHPGDVTISAVELASSNPFVVFPAISLARGVYDELDNLRAVLVLDLSAADIFPDRAASGGEVDDVIVVDDHRRYLYDSRYQDDWNAFLAERPALDLADRYFSVTSQILSGQAGGLLQANGHIVAFRPMLQRQGHFLVLIRSVPRAVALRSVAAIRWTFLLLFGASVALAALLSHFGAYQFTVPIQTLADGARRLEDRDYSHRLPMHGYDELDDLAATFNSMADAIEDRDGRIRAYMQDLESQVKARTEELLHAERLAAVGEMVTGIAHEIGTPLNVISGYAEDLLTQLEDAEAADDLHVIVSETERIADLVRGLQDFARPRPPARDWIDLGEAAVEVARLLRGATRKQGVQVDVEAGAGPAPAFVDPQEIKQALLNLVINAINASAAGDRVRVSVRGDDEQTAITVTDEGHGIEPAMREHIFEPFYTTRSPGQGTGLGLAIVKRIVERHDGDIIVESDPGVGSRFEISLPTRGYDVDAGR